MNGNTHIIKLYEKNIRDLQEQVNNAHKRIKVLSDENYILRRNNRIESDLDMT